MKMSVYLKKLEKQIEKKIKRLKIKLDGKLRLYSALLIIGLYLYGMFINSIRLGTSSIFGKSSTEVDSIWVLNPIRNILAVFSPTGLAVTAVCVLLILLISKKGYNALSGYKFIRDKRGFDILPDGTHGTSGWMKRKDMDAVLEVGKIKEIETPILGKLKDIAKEDDSFAEYVGLKDSTGLNRHIMVFGASGAGKSRGFVKPFILQTAKRGESLVLVDPKGEFFESMFDYLKNQGYTVKAFNLLDMENSDSWNCIKEIESDKNMVQSIAETIIRNTSNSSERGDFWEKSELNLFMALLLYVASMKSESTNKQLPIQERSLGTIYRLLAQGDFHELEMRFNRLDSTHPANAPYGIFKHAGRQLWGNIATGLGSRLNVFQNPLVDMITKHDEIDLELPGKEKCAYFCIISDQDSSLEFLSSLFFSMLFYRLSNYARRSGNNGRLPVPVNVCLDEFCNIGKLLDFKKTISTVRSRGINCQVIVQSAAQLSDRYPLKEWEEIAGNCDCQIFLGCNDTMTAKFISEKCGYLTIRVNNNQMPLMPLFAPVYSSTRPYSQTRSNTQRARMQPDEVLRLPMDEAIVFIRGQQPLKLFKVIPDEHPDFTRLRAVSISEYKRQSQFL